MSSSLSDACAYRLENFYSELQKAIFESVPASVKEVFLDDLLSSEEETDLETGRLLLDIMASSQQAQEPTGEKMFHALLLRRDMNTNQILKAILEITKSALGDLLFECAYTEKEKYYTAMTLGDMVHEIRGIARHLPKPCPPLKRFIPYDQGGREVLEQIKKDPTQALTLLQKEERTLTTPNIYATLEQVVKQWRSSSVDSAKSHLLQFISGVEETSRLPLFLYVKLFKEIQGESRYLSLTSLEKKGLFCLILSITIRPGVAETEESIQDLINLALEIHANCGGEALISFCMAPPMLRGVARNHAARALYLIKSWYLDEKQFLAATALLDSFYQDKIAFKDLLGALEKDAPALKLVPVEDTVSPDLLFKKLSGEAADPNVHFPLPQKMLEKIRKQYDQVHTYCKQWENVCMGELVHLAKNLAIEIQDKSCTEDQLVQLVAIGRLAIRQEFGIYPYNTQVCAVLSELQGGGGVVAQVKTGEGKSFITTLLSFVLVMSHKGQGHIITSSHSLCRRDQEESAKFFKAFGITTGHIAYEQPEAPAFQMRILYGTATDFEFAIMREMLQFTPLFPDKPVEIGEKRFAWVIVDEIDNLTIDTSLSGARLSSAAEVTYDWVYRPIFNFVKQNFSSEGRTGTSKILDNLKTHLKGYMGGRFASTVANFSDKKLAQWLENAWIALYQREAQKHYVVALDKSQGKKEKAIVIVDYGNTGRFMYGSRWNGGIHEFLEVKHGLEPKRENICPISMSHPVFYPLYRLIFGLTGTIGSRFERDELDQIYGIRSHDIPTHNPPQRIDAGITFVETDKELIELILQRALDNIATGRTLLILCESIQDTNLFGARLAQAGIPYELLNEEQKKSENEILELARRPGAVTIATNTATRGTDIKPFKEVLEKGGLHVPFTYYPESDRVEMQGRGRAGRQGQPGSSEILLSRERLNKDPKIAALPLSEIPSYLAKQREKKAVEEKDTHLAYAKVERYAFEKVQEFYQLLGCFHEEGEKEHFINTLAQFLKGRKFLKKETKDYNKLSPKNRKIAEAMLLLLNDAKDTTVQWRVLIKQVINKVQDHVINDFALNFHANITETIQASGLTRGLKQANKQQMKLDSIEGLETFAKIHEGLFREAADKVLEGIKQEINEVYQKQKPVWQTYLDLSGRGVIKYLSELTQIDLTPLPTDTFVPAWRSNAKEIKKALAFDRDFVSETQMQNSVLELMKKTVSKSPTPLSPKEAELSKSALEEMSPAASPGSPVRSKNTYTLYLEEEVETPVFPQGSSPPPPPVAGMRRGLQNMGNTCWANSFLKFMGCTNFYDRALIAPSSPGHERLQALLRQLLTDLRMDKEIAENSLLAFLREVEQKIPGMHIGVMQDAPEFFIALLRLMHWTPLFPTQQELVQINQAGQFPRLGLVFEPSAPLPAGWHKYPTIHHFQTHLEVTIREEDALRDQLDLSALIEDRGTVEVRPEGEGITENREFITKACLLNLPSTLMVYIKRAMMKDGVRTKCNGEIKLNSDCQIALKGYDPVMHNNKVVSLKERETALYHIGAAVVHYGATLESGHYICFERSPNGQLLSHSDLQVTPHNTEANFGTSGYFIRLDKVR